MKHYKSRPAFGRHNVTAREATAKDVAAGVASAAGDFIVETEGYAPQWSPRDEFLERYELGEHDFAAELDILLAEHGGELAARLSVLEANQADGQSVGSLELRVELLEQEAVAMRAELAELRALTTGDRRAVDQVVALETAAGVAGELPDVDRRADESAAAPETDAGASSSSSSKRGGRK